MSDKRQWLRGEKSLFAYEKKQPEDPFHGRRDLPQQEKAEREDCVTCTLQPFLFKSIFKKETEKVYRGSVQSIERRTGELHLALNKAPA